MLGGMIRKLLLVAFVFLVGCKHDPAEFRVTKTFHSSGQFIVEGHTDAVRYRLSCEEGPGEYPCFYMQAGAVYHIKPRDLMETRFNYVSFQELPGSDQVFKVKEASTR